ncbi:uncharacterized protein LOC116515507 [Thamnophis elegans]|uniref:uncharacterized protein LOC116515507 n=1 Tax=Thamnophis elegans TaxID=35005 RepID=UPI00137701E7|nr:uncharacterized protein LOC116515507 [Thamnophis elegans]
MKAPVCLVENRRNRLHVSPEALRLLSDIRQPVVVVSIVGPYRTGKSYLMNKLAGKNSGFPLGSIEEAETKGIWMWCVPHPDRPNQTLVLLDTEGLGYPEKGSPENDAWIFTLAVLLSSTLIYNSIGTIDQTALDKLHFVTELSELIKAKSSSTTGDTDDSSEFVCFFPNFVWSVRDFTLQLQRDGKSITEDEYLKHALKLKEGDSKKEQAFNLPRQCIRLFFPTRKCFVFDCPTKSRNLPYVEKMVDNQLEPEFVEQAKKFCHHIYETSREKTLPGGHIVTGNLLAKLVKAYVDTISSGNVPCLENEVLALAEVENRVAVQEAVAHYAQLMEQSVELPTETLQELLDVHKKCEEEALKKFMDRSFKDDTRQFQAEFMKTVNSKKEEYCSKNGLKSSEICSALLSSLSENLEQNIKNGSYSRSGGHQEFVNDLQKVEKQFLETPKKGIMAGKILKEFLQSKENISKTILQCDMSLQKKDKETEDAKMKAKAKELEDEVQKQKEEMGQQKFADQKQSYEMTLQKLMEKLEEERKQILEELKKMIQRTLKEELAAFGYCSCKKSVRGAQEEKEHGGLRRESGSDPLISLERCCISSKARMEAPVCLVENRRNRLQVSPKALRLLSDIQNPVVVVSIVGPYYTGKSYLMNRLAGKNSGFSLGATVEAKTNGIWMWCLPHPDRPNQTLILLDTEGLGDVEKGSPENDTWIFSLAVLLSSTLVYNSVGTIDQTALDKLHFVTELSKHIKAKSSSTPGDTDDTSEFVGFVPTFVWAVRDFTLQLQRDGKSITEDEYLENALKLKKGDSKKEQAFNLPQKCIRVFFPTRKCFTFYCPTTPENLCNVEQMSDDQLHKGFVEQAKKFCHYIYETSQEKTLPGGHIVTGNLLAKLVKAYVDTISSGNVPCLENEVLALAEVENRVAVQEAVAHYAQLMEHRVELPTETLQELLDVHKKCEEQALKKFIACSFKDDTRQFLAQFMKTVESKKEEYCRKNELKSSEICSALLSSLSENLEQNIKNGRYSRPGGHPEFVNDLQKVEKEFLEIPKKGIMTGKILKEFLQSKENIGKTILQCDVSLQKKDKEIEDAKMKAKELEDEVQKQKEEMGQQKFADQKQSYEMNRQKLMEKLEEEKKQILEQQEKMIQRKPKESVDSKKEEYCSKNGLKSSEICSALLRSLSENLEENIKNGSYSRSGGHQEFVNDLQKVEKQFLETPKKGIMAGKILKEFLQSKENISKTILQCDVSLQKKDKEIEDAKIKAKAKELEDEVQKQKQEMGQQRFEDQKQSYEMSLQKLMEKLEEEKKQILEQQEKMIQRTLKESVDSKKEEYCSKNGLKSSEICSALLRSLSENLEQKIKNGSYSRSGGHQEFVNDLQKVEKQFLETPKKGIMAGKILKEFLQSKENISKTILQCDVSLQKKEKEIEDAKMKAKAKKLEDELQKQKEEMGQQKFADRKQSYEMNRQKLMEKLEEEKKQILEQQEKMIQRKPKEELAAFGYCSCKKSVRGAQEEKEHGGLRRESGSDPLISLERCCISSKARMEAPVCLVENRRNRLQVSPKALRLLSDIQNPVVVVSIVGPYYTGKSYLMNRLAGKNSGFSLGATVEAKTNGIWMWCLPHPDRPNQTLILLDTEGLGDVEKGSPENDTWIFSLTVLLSSTLVYNSVGTIDQTALDKLHFVTELSKHIKAKSSSTPGDTDDTSGFVGFFPTFVWAVRDFTLQLQRDGKSITEDDYLENALKLKKGDSKKEQGFNLPRKCIRLFFPTRKCFTFYCPTTPENLCNVGQMSDDQLHKGFVEQAKKFCHYIYETSQEKTLPGGHIVTGNLLAKLVKAYVDTISSGNVPCLENEVLALAEIENRAAVQEAVACYAQLMEQSMELPTETLQELLDVHKNCEEQALKKFMARAFTDDKYQFQGEFMKTVESKKEEYCRKNELKSSEICSALLSSLSENLEQNIKNGSYSRSGGHQEFVNDLRKVEKEFLETPKKGIMAGKILKEFLQSKENISKTILQSDVSLQEKEKEIEEGKMKAKAKELEDEVLRQEIKMLQQIMEDQKRSYEMNLQKIMEKMEEEMKKMKKEYEKMI